MEPQYKSQLKSIVLNLRHILEGNHDAAGTRHPGDLEERLAAIGVHRGREPLPLSQLPHLLDEDKRAREVVDAFVRSHLKAGRTSKEAVQEFLQEAAYTWANRLIALRCLEARGLIDEVILQKENYGGRSLQHHRLAQQKPDLCTSDDDGLFAVLFAEFSRLSQDLPLLFDPEAPVIALRPGVAALKSCIRSLCAPDAIFTAPDALGWAYQYWNTEEKDRVFEKVRTIKGAKIEKSDIIPVTQLYTERYMVKFLVQNSLGALWMVMHPDSRLCASWEYYVRDADRALIKRKPLRKCSFLDPSVGSGHFLLEAFDLLYTMYEEEGELKTPGEICEAILTHNLYGIDIDERSIQIAALALYMKAKEKDPDFQPRRLNLTATNIHPSGETDHLNDFLTKHPDYQMFQNPIRMIFDSLEHADELGSLLQIEEPVEKEFRYLKALEDEDHKQKTKQSVLFQEMAEPEQKALPLDASSYDEWKAGLLHRLSEHIHNEWTSTDFSTRFFGETAEKGLTLFDFLSRRYDVVATNPPYMGSKNMGAVVKRYIEAHFVPGKRDLYAAFILRCLELARPETGRVAMVTQQSWMFLRSFADLRTLDEEKLKKAKGFRGILRETSIETLAHLGPGAFGEISGEVVNIVLFTLAKTSPNTDHRLTAFRLIGPKGPEEKKRLLQTALRLPNSNFTYIVKQQILLKIIESPLVYWLGESSYKVFDGAEYFLGNQLFFSKGIRTSDDKRWLRFWWEIDNHSRWISFSKGGRYVKWYGNDLWVIDWQNNGEKFKTYIAQKYPPEKFTLLIRHDRYFKTDGWAYSAVGRGSVGVRFHKNFIATDTAPTVRQLDISEELFFKIIKWMNSRPVTYFARSLNPASVSMDKNYIERIPLTNNLLKTTVSVDANWYLSFKKYSYLTEIIDRAYECRINLWLQSNLLSESILLSAEALLDERSSNAYGFSDTDKRALSEELGYAAGCFPLIENYHTLPPLPEGLPEIPEEVLTSLNTHERRAPEIQELAAIKSRLRTLYEAGPGAKEEIDDAYSDASDDDEEENEQAAVGARIPIPAETFLEELSQKLEVHPISVYWLLKEGIEKDGWHCLPEEQRLTKDRFTVLILRLLGHRWPKQIEAGEPVPTWADNDGIIPLLEGSEEATLYQRLRVRLAADHGDQQVSTEENTFSEIMGKSLNEWVKQGFFRHHISQFKKRPIAWHLTSARWNSRRGQEAACEFFIYCHKMDGDLLPKLRSHYLGPLQKRFELELHGLENQSGKDLSAEQETRKELLRAQIEELKSLDKTLAEVIADGFGPAGMKQPLRQYAINDAMLYLKVCWLRKLSTAIQNGPLEDWRKKADQTRQHADFSTWIAEAMMHLDYHCAVVGPQPPDEKTLRDDPTPADLARIICADAETMEADALKHACTVWWKSFNAHVLKPLSEKIRDAKKQIQSLKEIPQDPKGDFKKQSEVKRTMNSLKVDIKVWQNELAQRTVRGQGIKEAILSWRCPEAITWESWLVEQEMFDQVSSLNEKRPPPKTVAEFMQQESLYQPDINDGVRVNIAPLQKARLLTAEVLAGKDVDKAIADRAVWRDDERRWCREGKLPKPGWWE
jgi:hypothetical protein